jgi:hypothetical protein
MSKKTSVKLRVLYSQFGKNADDVIIVDADTARTCVGSGWCDDEPAAVKFALSLGGKAEEFALPAQALDDAVDDSADDSENAEEDAAEGQDAEEGDSANESAEAADTASVVEE